MPAPAGAPGSPAAAHAPSSPAPSPSLRTRLLRRVMLPLALTWLLGTLVTYLVASYATQQALDRSTLDDAYSLATNLRPNAQGEVVMQLHPHELRAALFDQTETVYFSVRRPDQSLLVGQPIDIAPPAAGESHRFADLVLEGHAVRAVALRHPVQNVAGDYLVIVGHTTLTRRALAWRVLAYATLPQVLLLALLATWLRRVIARDLAPLAALHTALDRRDANDLSPVPERATTREVERMGQAVNALFERLGRSVQSQREFTGNVAHELRTPLAGIRALADYGLANTAPAVWREQLQRIAASEARASHLVDQLLALALADENDAVLQREPVRLDQLVGQVVLRHLPRADARGVDLGARGLDEGHPDELTVPADAALVEGILDNLIDNALRYGGPTITVELSTAPGQCTLAVVDDGPGIPEAARQDLMQRWSQGADGQKLGQGAGLGLAIVARYAQLLGAPLSLADASPQGGLRVALVFHRAAPETSA